MVLIEVRQEGKVIDTSVVVHELKVAIKRDLCRLLLSNSYTMSCPTVRGDNLRALASGLSYVQKDEHDITILDGRGSLHFL